MILRKNAAYNKDLYKVPYDHTKWVDHKVRIEDAKACFPLLTPAESCADLSAGDGALIDSFPAYFKYKGDICPGYDICGPIEETIHTIPKVDCFILTETLEHVEAPGLLLNHLREKTSRLLLSTPLNEPENFNHEHLWVWDNEGIEEMLRTVGFVPVLYKETSFIGVFCSVRYQTWVCV